jgi:DNA polymerase-1
MTMRGVQLDRVLHQRKIAEWSQALADARQAFATETGRAPPTTPDELRAHLQITLPPDYLAAWPVTPKSQKLSVRTSQLNRVAHLPAVRPLLEIAALETLLEGFGPTLADKVSDATGRLHPGYHIASTKAGRSSSSRPNIQQIPGGKKAPGFRDCIVAAPGYVLVVADFSMMELRAAAEISGDAQMRQDFADGIDLHARLASDLLGVPIDAVPPDQRSAAKPINFGTIYGAGGAALAASAWNGYGIAMTADEASAARTKFLQRYATHATWMRRHATLCNRQGKIEIGHLGRVIEAAWEQPKQNPARHYVRQYDDGDEPYADLAEEAGLGEEDESFWYPHLDDDLLKYTICCNVPIQGACADIAMLALLKAEAAFAAAKVEGGLVLFIHDEIGAEVVARQAEQARIILTQAMTEAFAMVFPDAPLNKLVANAIGPSWGAAKP